MEKTLMQAFTFAGITKREGQQLPQFAMEIKALTPEDRNWFKEQFKKEYGITIIESPKS